MTTAKNFRRILIECAKSALEREADDKNLRARYFVAMVSGSAAACGEDSVQQALRELLGLPTSTTGDGA